MEGWRAETDGGRERQTERAEARALRSGERIYLLAPRALQ
jgi:hypothetical protein